MATSGTYTFSINRDTLVASAFRLLGVFNDGDKAPTSDIANAVQALNLMIKQWMSEGYLLWTVDTITLPIVADKVVYTIGPGGDLPTYRPLRVIDAWSRDTNNGNLTSR